MPRNVIDTVARVFEILRAKYEGAESPPLTIVGEQADIDLIKHIDLRQQYFFTGKTQGFCRLEYANTTYFCLIGFNSQDWVLRDLGITEIDMSPGIWTVLVSDLNLQCMVSSDTLADNLFEAELSGTYKQTSTGYYQIPYSDLEGYFPVLSVFELGEDCIYTDGFALFISLLCKNNSLLPHLQSEQVVSAVAKILSDLPPNIFPFEYLLNALWANSYKMAFLSLYHCVECLFQPHTFGEIYREVYLNRGCTDTSCKMDFVSFIALMDRQSFRTINSADLQRLFGMIEEEDADKRVLLNTIRRISGNPQIQDIGKYISETRNKVVHLSFIDKDKPNKEDTDWEDLIAQIIPFLPKWYNSVAFLFS